MNKKTIISHEMGLKKDPRKQIRVLWVDSATARDNVLPGIMSASGFAPDQARAEKRTNSITRDKSPPALVAAH